MNYNEFKIAMTAQVANLVGEEVNVTMRQVHRNNGIVMEGLAILDHSTNLSPTIYLEAFYKKHQEGVSLENLAKLLLQEYEEKKPHGKVCLDYFLDFNRIRSRVCFRLINYEKNRLFLKDVPHVRYLDLAMVFYYYVDELFGDTATVLVRNCDADRWKTNVDELEALAMENTPRRQPVKIISMDQVVEEIFEEEGDSLKLSQLEKEFQDAVPMYIMTNAAKNHGAGIICYPGILEALEEFIGGAFYVLPSSIHEVIITPDSGIYSKEELEEMVTDINRTEVDAQEVLSNHPYFYDTKTKELTM